MMMRKLIFFVFVFNFINIIDGNFPLPAITPEYCNSTEFYDSICVKCKRCGRDDNQASLQHRALDGSCQCKSEYYTKSRKGPHNVTCDACSSGKFPSSDGKSCLSCGSSNPYNETSGNCEPCLNGILIEDGKELICLPCQRENEGSITRCDSCSSSIIPNAESCAVLNKVYFGGVCVSSAPSEPSQLIVKFENGVNVLSDFFAKHLAAALENCKVDDAACQALANMCVMTMYKIISIEKSVCAEFRMLSKKRLDECPKKHDLLWLFYIDEDAQRDARRDLHKDNVPNVFAPYPAQRSQLHIYAMKYALNGTFLGFFKVTSDTLNLCPESDVEDDIAFSFGTQLHKSCKLSLQHLWKKSELVFYDLYLAYNDSKSEFYPIPVHIRGISVNGEYVNKGSDMSKWLLVRRFFLTDHVSGIENGTKLSRKQHQPLAKVFRYASDVSLKITTRTDGSPGMIYPPLLTITYSEAVPEDYMKNKKVTIKFSVSYEKDQSTVKQGVLISHAVLGIIAFVWSSVQTYSWFRRSDKHAVDLLTLGKFIVFMCGNLANVFFVVSFFVSLKWFVFFKRQDVIYTLLPTADQEQFLSIYLGVAFTMKAIQLIHLLAVQCNINIFFIDWERPRVRASSTSGRVSSSSKNVAETSADGKKTTTMKGTPDKINTEMAGVSIWRTYFAANEWAEIQSKRKLNLGLQVFGVLFFLKVLDFEDYALAGPNFNLPSSEVKKYVPYSTCCRFALGASVYLSVALFQVIFRKAIYERFIEDKLQQYVDLCSVSNVSVFILITKRFGYYIHGRSTHGKADVNMKEMHEYLRKEEEDLCGHRGLIPNTEQQTFQIVLPSGVHDQFLRLLVPLTSYTQAADRMQGVGGRLAKVDIDRVANTHYMLNKFLSGFIEHSFKDLDYVVKDKVLLENLLDIECYEVADRGYFYNDDGHSFSAVLFYGNEAILLLFDVLLFSIIDIAASDYVLSTILTGLIARFIMSVRRSAGRRNLVRKALVDERFLT